MMIFLNKRVMTWWLIALLLLANLCFAQSGNHVFGGGEAANFGVIDLTTPGTQTWSTNRSATPGYFSAVGIASYTSPGDAAHINGYVKQYATVANQGFSYPIGSGTDYRNLSISGTRSVTSVIASAWIPGDPGNGADSTAPNSGAHITTALGTGISAVSPVGQWDWQDISDDAAGLTATVSIPDMSTFAPAANLRLVGWNGTQWINLSAAATASGNTENSTLSGTLQNGITALAVGTIVAALPDLTPGTDIDDLNFAASQARDFTVNIFEILGGQTSGTVSFRVTRLSGWDITVPGITLSAADQSGITGSSNVSGGTVHENENWFFRQNTGFITMTLKPGFSIAASGLSTLGFTATRKAGTASGTVQNITATVVTASGGETNAANNQVITSMTAN
jgi:hypothetical protein